jgi:hypothetical protein
LRSFKTNKTSKIVCVRKMRDEMADLVRFNKGNGRSGQVEREIVIIYFHISLSCGGSIINSLDLIDGSLPLYLLFRPN